MAEEAILAELFATNTASCKPPLKKDEVNCILRSALRYQRDYTLTESGNAERFAARFLDQIYFSPQRKCWLVPNNGIWTPDDSGKSIQSMKTIATDLFQEAAPIDEDSARKATVNWAKQSLSAARIRNGLELAKSEPGIVAILDDFDRHPMLIAVENGVLDLENGELLPHNLSLKLTKRAPVRWDETATCPKWEKFLQLIFADDSELISYIQRLCGYLLTGDTSEQIFPIFWGTGKNGKSTLLAVLRGILGDYARHVQPELIRNSARQPNAATPSIARLRGARLVTTQETESNHWLAESLIKQITGGDPIEARDLYKESFEFIPEFKLVLATNHEPSVHGTDFALWRRIHLVPFTEVVPSKKCIRDFHKDLLEEASGILNWMVDGCLIWSWADLAPPPKVTEATAAYQEDQDRIGQFLRDTRFSSDTLPRTEVYLNYKHWTLEGGMKPLSSTKFYKELTRRGFKHKTVHGDRKICGLPNNSGQGTDARENSEYPEL